MGARSQRLRLGVMCRWAGAVVLAGAAFAIGQAPGSAQGSRTLEDGLFTEAQAVRGGSLYADQCASCHGAGLEGAQAPPLVGARFVERWSPQPLSALARKIHRTMPAAAEGSLSTAQSVDLIAHILRQGGFPTGGTELVPDEEALSLLTWPAGLAPAAVGAGPVGQGRVYPPLGNMAQLMRGIFFPNSNLIFTVQTHDPAAPARAPEPGAQGGGFSWVDWGAGIYGGWELVDNAAIALADASPLMLTEGVRCENGRAAPVTDEDWIRYTEDLIAVSRRLYELSQSRDQEAVSLATGDLADACFACHSAYRDVRIPGQERNPLDPSNKAARCMPR